MCLSATKSVLSMVAGLAYDRGLIDDVHAPVHNVVDLSAFAPTANRAVTWHHRSSKPAAGTVSFGASLPG